MKGVSCDQDDTVTCGYIHIWLEGHTTLSHVYSHLAWTEACNIRRLFCSFLLPICIVTYQVNYDPSCLSSPLKIMTLFQF